MVCEAHAQTGDRHDEDDAGPLTEPESVLDDELPAGLLFISAVGVGNGGHARDIGRRTGRLKFLRKARRSRSGAPAVARFGVPSKRGGFARRLDGIVSAGASSMVEVVYRRRL